LKKKYHKNKIGILAHSWGTVIGSIYANQYKEDVAFYIGVGQVIDPNQDEAMGYKETIRRLEEIEDENGLKRMKELGDYPGNSPSVILDKMVIVREMQTQLGMANYNVQKM
jgi:pimeloyl-ACP methyl ester carboxylesterase